LSGERKERKNKKIIISGNQIIISLHVSHLVEEGTVAHQRRRRMARFGHRADATHSLVHMEHTPITFQLTIKNKT
jgi:hypothetical protein